MAIFEKAVEIVMRREGHSKTTDIKGDKGGLTKYGISKTAHPSVDIANLTYEQALGIYKRDYWDKVGGDLITSQSVALVIFDAAVNMGNKQAVLFAQRSARVPVVDGVMGRISLDYVNNTYEAEFLHRFFVAKVKYYAGICMRDREQSKFLLGWINRALEDTP